MKLFNLSSLTSVVPIIRETFLRFPLSLTCLICTTALGLLAVHDIELFEPHLPKILATLIYGAVAFASLKLLVESENWAPKKHMIAAMLVLALIIIYVWSVFVEEAGSTYLLFSLAVGLSLLFAPYVKRSSSPSSVWYFNYQTSVAIFFAGIAALVLGIGMALILASIGYLFEVKIAGRLYGDIWILSWGILFGTYVLSNLSKEFDFEEAACAFPKGISFITNYILVPLMFAYISILYAYFIKITIQWELPRGNLGWMITTFGTIGITTKLLSYPIRDQGTRLLKLFDQYYYHALIVPTLLLFIAIGARIYEYGFTEQRYAVVLLGIWFTSVTIMALFKKEQFHIKHAPIILALLAFFASFGPWSAVEVSTRSQVNRFESLLLKHDLLGNGKAIKSTTEVPFEDLKSLSSIATYLGKTDYRFERIEPWFHTLIQASDKEDFSDSKWSRGRELIELLGLKYITRWQKTVANHNFSYNTNYELNKLLQDISGYDFITQSSQYVPANKPVIKTYEYSKNSKNNKIIFSRNKGIFYVKDEHGDQVIFDLGDHMNYLRKNNITEIKNNNIAFFTLNGMSENKRLKAKLIINSIHGKYEQNQPADITSMQYTLLINISQE